MHIPDRSLTVEIALRSILHMEQMNGGGELQMNAECVCIILRQV